MRTFGTFSLVVTTLGCTSPTQFNDGGDDTPATPGMTYTWSFDDTPTGTLPADMFDVLGNWVVDQGALLQSGSFHDGDFPRVLVENLTFTDLHLSVRCRPEAGSGDQACGLVFRAVDSDNYFITRANALEGNVNLYRVVNGDRQQFAGANATVTSGEWHTLEADATGTNLVVTWDGAVVITSSDGAFARGAIGVWTKADSVTRFDDLTAIAK